MEPGRSGDANAGPSSWGHGPESQAVNGLLTGIARPLAAFAGPGPPGQSSVCSRLRLLRTADFRPCVGAPLSVAWTRSPSQSTTNSGDRW